MLLTTKNGVEYGYADEKKFTLEKLNSTIKPNENGVYLFTHKQSRADFSYFLQALSGELKMLSVPPYKLVLQELSDYYDDAHSFFEPVGDVWVMETTIQLLAHIRSVLFEEGSDFLKTLHVGGYASSALKDDPVDTKYKEAMRASGEVLIYASDLVSYCLRLATLNRKFLRFVGLQMMLPTGKVGCLLKMARHLYTRPTSKIDDKAIIVIDDYSDAAGAAICKTFQVNEKAVRKLKEGNTDLPSLLSDAYEPSEVEFFLKDELDGWRPPLLKGYEGPVVAGYMPSGELAFAYSDQRTPKYLSVLGQFS